MVALSGVALSGVALSEVALSGAWMRKTNARYICSRLPTRHLLQDFFGQLALDRGQLTVFLVLHVLLLRKERL